MEDLPPCREQQFGVFTAAQARTFGIGKSRIHRLVAAGELVVVRRGVYREQWRCEAASAEEDQIVQSIASALTHPGSAVSHESASLIYGLPQLRAVSSRPTITMPRSRPNNGDQRRRQKIMTSELPEGHLAQRGDWAVTSVNRTLCDLGRTLPGAQAVAITDAAMNHGLTSRKGLTDFAEFFEGWPGAKVMRDVLQCADPGSESPYESLARVLLQKAGMTALTQVWAFDAQGPIGCGDIWLPELWTYLEVDGDVKYHCAASTALIGEKRRQERLEDAGFGVARVSPAQIASSDDLVRRVTRSADRAHLLRRSLAAPGYVGPPPSWARRGTRLDIAKRPI